MVRCRARRRSRGVGARRADGRLQAPLPRGRPGRQRRRDLQDHHRGLPRPAGGACRTLFDDVLDQLAEPSYEEDGILFGPFYDGNEGTALYNSEFRPFQSPAPFLFVRHTVLSDWKFFLEDDALLDRWARHFGPSATAALGEELRRLPWRTRKTRPETARSSLRQWIRTPDVWARPHHARLRKSGGLRDTTPCIPEVADDTWLYNAVDVTASRLAKGFGSPEFSPRFPRGRSTVRRRSRFETKG